MFKKILLTLILVFNLGLAPTLSYAQGSVAPDDALESGFFMFDLGSITHEDVKEEKFIRGGINFIFERVVTIMAATIGSAAVMMITIGGFMILASAGRQQWVDTGKSFIFKSLIGLAFALGAYILVQTVQLLIKSIYG